MAISLRKKVDSKKEKKVTKRGTSVVVTLILMVVILVGSIGSSALVEVATRMYNQKVNHDVKFIESYSFKSYIRSFNDQHKYTFEGSWDNDSIDHLNSLKYYVKDIKSGNVHTNIEDPNEGRIRFKSDKYLYYLNLKMDGTDNYIVEENKGITKGNFRSSDKFDYDNVKYEFIYYLDEDYKAYNDRFMSRFYGYIIGDEVPIYIGIALLFAIVIFILGLLLSYDLMTKSSVFRVYNRMYLEFKIILCVALGFLMFGVAITTNGYLGNFSLESSMFYKDAYFYLVYSIDMFILGFMVLLNTVYLKYIYFNGFVKGLVFNSFSARIIRYIYTRIRRSIKKTRYIITDIILGNDDNKSKAMWFKVLFINMIILFAIAILREIGIIIAIVYTMLLFRFFINYTIDLRNLNSCVEELTKGNFNTEFNQKILFLDPLIEKLNMIRQGFKLAVDKETRSERLKAELISNVSHDLRTPLTSIINYVDLMKKEDLNETQIEYMDILDKKSQRIKILIDDLFEVSKASSGSIELNISEIDIVALLRQTMGEFKEQIDESELTFKLNLPEEKVTTSLDGRRTYRIFENLISNILKYSLKGSRVYIDVIDEEKQIQVVFKNISAYEMDFNADEIMNRLNRGDKSRNTEGSGLGLAIAKSLITLQSGKIKIDIDGDLFKATLTFIK